MTATRPVKTIVAALGLAAVCALALGACGEEESEPETTTGGEIQATYTAQPDALDPALSYTQGGWEPMWLVYTPLLTYAHDDGAEGSEVIPGLAEALPEISADGLTYTLTLRDGLTYSDGTPVVASDFEHSVKRVLNLESGGASFFLGIEGAQAYLEGNNPDADISGIEADDETGEITITLVAPDATFTNVLAMNFAGLVPGETPFENLTKDPPPGVGPYVITSSEPNRQFVVERREDFADLGLDAIPDGSLDRVTVTIQPDLATQAQDVSSNEVDYMLDSPPADLLPEIRDESSSRFAEFESGAVTYLFLNSAVEPFDDEQVREAVAIALDKPGIARLFGGLLEPTCNMLPSTLPGYEEVTECPQGDPDGPPDLAAARQLIAAAGAEGAKVKVWSANEGPAEKAAIAIADSMSAIGLDAEPELVDFAVFFQSVTAQSTGAQSGIISFIQDFPHPANFLGSFSGDVITEKNNLNVSNADDPVLTNQIEELKQEPDIDVAAPGWAEVDHAIVEADYAVPLGHPLSTTFMSERMDFENCQGAHPVYVHDWSRFCLD